MEHRTESIEGFDVVGVRIRTNNTEAMEAIGALWARFTDEGLGERIPSDDGDLLALYTAYESDHTGDYEYLIGKRVATGSDVPGGLSRVRVRGGTYAVVAAEGEMPQALVGTWGRIWESDLARAFTTDFEIYPPDRDDRVEIWLALTEG